MRVFVRPAQIPNMSSINRLNVQLYVKRALCNDIFLVHSAVILIHSGVFYLYQGNTEQSLAKIAPAQLPMK